jgi:CubicO group peptidase (beta-lactamase class C family)
MLSAIVQKVSGEKLIDYLQPRLFAPLGISNATWETCPLGINTGGFGLSVKTEDIARLGQLYLDKGVWQGKQILPEAWVAEATARQVSNSNPNPTGNKATDTSSGVAGMTSTAVTEPLGRTASSCQPRTRSWR